MLWTEKGEERGIKYISLPLSLSPPPSLRDSLSLSPSHARWHCPLSLSSQTHVDGEMGMEQSMSMTPR